jgi:hypothetical protein
VGFLLINLGILIAVRAVSRPEHRPYAARYLAATEECEAAQIAFDEAHAELTEGVGGHNELLRQVHGHAAQVHDAMIASDANATRQSHRAANRAQLAQPEMFSEPMFPQGLPGPMPFESQNGLRQYLTLNAGAVTSSFHRYAPLDLAPLEQRFAEMEARRRQRWQTRKPQTTGGPHPRRRTSREEPERTRRTRVEELLARRPDALTTSPRELARQLSTVTGCRERLVYRIVLDWQLQHRSGEVAA